MKTTDFAFETPAHLVAQEPTAERDASRLLVHHAAANAVEDAMFSQLPAIVARLRELSGAQRVVFVANDTRVYPARVRVRRATGARGEVFLLRPRGEGPWECLLRPQKKLKDGEDLHADGEGGPGTALLRIVSVDPPRVEIASEFLEANFASSTRAAADTGPRSEAALAALLAAQGEMPLPPYIERDRERDGARDAHARLDLQRYQTVYAGGDAASAAAPTAGLHFTPGVMEACREAGADFTFVTLHVGLGTFAPVQTDDIEDHPMHEERACVPAELASRLRAELEYRAQVSRREPGPVSTNGAAGEPTGLSPRELFVCVGTTALRTVESFLRVDEGGQEDLAGRWFSTRLFLHPGADGVRIRPRLCDALLTNFHQPQSTLAMLVAALVGVDAWRTLYAHAIAAEYRFFSYGDANLLLLDDTLGSGRTLVGAMPAHLGAAPTRPEAAQ